MDMQWTVNQALLAAPDLVATFKRLGIDSCCGGNRTLDEAARSIGMTPDALRAALGPIPQATRAGS